MTKSKNPKTRSIPLVIFFVTGIAVVLFLCVGLIYQYVQNSRNQPPRLTNSEQCEIDSRNITAEERASPLYEPPASCLYATQEPNEPYKFGR
jgi:hypothetical protein